MESYFLYDCIFLEGGNTEVNKTFEHVRQLNERVMK